MFAKIRGSFIIPAMKIVSWILPACGLALFLSSCGAGGGKSAGAAGTPGPFDRNGNYVEEWADNPSKWRKPGQPASPHEVKSDEIPEIAMRDQPPQNSVPLAPARQTSTPVISKTNVTRKPSETTKTTSSSTGSSKPKTVASSTKPATKSSSNTKSTASKSTTKTASKTSTASKTTKAKPKTTRYTVKKGDSLSAIASRTGSSSAAIKRANGISGSVIRPGQTLVIPK